MKKRTVYLLSLTILGGAVVLGDTISTHASYASTRTAISPVFESSSAKSLKGIVNNKRFQVKDTTQSIYQSIVNIPIIPNASSLADRATGFVVGRDKILTCAHVSENTNSTLKVVPALNGEKEPYGEFKIDKVDIPKGYYSGGDLADLAYDYSVVTVSTNSKGEHIGDVVGCLNLRAITIPELVTGTPMRLIGYPGDKGGEQMWDSPGKLMRDDGYYGDDFFNKLLGPHFLEFDADMIPGNSGSPVLDSNNNVIGFTNLDSDNGKDFGNGATMLDPQAMEWINSKL